jgi:cytochrome c peroxidase
MTGHARTAALLLLCLLGACGGGGAGTTGTTAATMATPAAAATQAAPPPTLAQVGDRLFDETALSASDKLACASCHVEARGHADAAGVFLPLGAPTAPARSAQLAHRALPRPGRRLWLRCPGPAAWRAVLGRPRRQPRALGAPRNASRATRDPAFFDLGLCARSDPAGRAELCGLFRTPSLRNVALTAPYFHNASFATLEDAVAFYATRDLDPARWYPVVDSQVQRYNDLPAAYRANVQQGAPFRRAGQPPALTPQDVADVVAFLNTLTDGFSVPAAP